MFHNTLFWEDWSLVSLPLSLLACDPRSESQLLKLQWIWDWTTGCVPELIIWWNPFNPLILLLFLWYSALTPAPNSHRPASGCDSCTLNPYVSIESFCYVFRIAKEYRHWCHVRYLWNCSFKQAPGIGTRVIRLFLKCEVAGIRPSLSGNWGKRKNKLTLIWPPCKVFIICSS